MTLRELTIELYFFSSFSFSFFSSCTQIKGCNSCNYIRIPQLLYDFPCCSEGQSEKLMSFSSDFVFLFFFFLVVQPSKTSKQCPGAVTEGHTVKLLCNFTGDPLPSVAWNRADTRRTLSNSGVLFLKDIKRSDSGIYECLAWNGIGNNSTEFCMIDVNCK